MSKRTETARAASARRGLMRLRDVRIRSKLGLILIIPVLAILGLAVIRLVDIGQQALQADEVRSLALFSANVADVTHELQRERSQAGFLLGANPEPAAVERYETQTRRTDAAINRFNERREQLPELPRALRVTLDRVARNFEELLPQLRLSVVEQRLNIYEATYAYNPLISDLLTYREALAQLGIDSDLATQARAAAALSRNKDALTEEHIVGLRAYWLDQYTLQLQREFVSAISGQESARNSFVDAATQGQWELLQRTYTDSDVQQALIMERSFRILSPGPHFRDAYPGGFDPVSWTEAMEGAADALRDVEQEIDQQIIDEITHRRDSQVRQVLIESGIVLVILVVAILVALFVAQSMARSLWQLREGALKVAYESLPESVARLRDPETLGELTPEEVANQVKDPVTERGRDEIGEVARAFNTVHREAVRVAAEQAALRANVATMFINLARRSQVLVDRLIGHLDRLERGEEDPDRLAQLFQLDHLATRMRRNDENLLVLAGADSTRVQREPASLSDVLRAAQSEVEQYTRIEFGIVDRDVDVAPHAVNDVVHLLAELLDNATSFSPPDTTVVVDARRAGDRVILQIEDRGIGISPEQLAELNARLASPPLVDVAVSRMMGLVVVGRLAARHGIQVELRAAAERGTIADVVLPGTVLILPQRRNRQHTLGLPQGRTAVAALESTGPEKPHSEPQRSDWLVRSQPSKASTGGSLLEPRSEPWRQEERRRPEEQAPERPQERRPATTGTTGGLATTGGLVPEQRQPEQRSTQAAQSSVFSAFERPRDVSANRSTPADTTPRTPTTSNGLPSRGGLPQRRPGSAMQPSASPAEPPTTPPPVSPPPPPARPARDEPAVPLTGARAASEPRTAADASPSQPPAGTSATSTSGTGWEPGPDDTALIPASVDDTMELPIFREVESAWFRTHNNRTQAASAATSGGRAAMAERPTTSASMSMPASSTTNSEARSDVGQSSTPSTADRFQTPVGHFQPSAPPPGSVPPPLPTRSQAKSTSTPSTDVPPPARPSAPSAQASTEQSASSGWRTAADEGWRAASAASRPEIGGITKAGLPKRVPMAQLVPGGVEPTTPITTRARTPEAVRGLLSAYHRGVQRGRSQHANSAIPNPRNRSTHGASGKEQEA